MHTRQLGPFSVSAIGLGCMNLSHGYGRCEPEQAERVLIRALELGYNLFDTAAIYGIGANEMLLGRVLKPYRDQITLASKCALDGDALGGRTIDGSRENIHRMCDVSLQRLQTDMIDLYYLHRKDPNTEIETSMEALAELKTEGKIRAVGLSEVSATTIRRAHAIHPVTAVQSEYSLWSRGAEREVLDTCDELGISFIPFSPVGRGMLTATLTHCNFADGDLRSNMPRFQPEVFTHNLQVVNNFADLAAEFGYSPAQLSLAWLLNKGNNLIPIPGTCSLLHLEENSSASDVQLSTEDLKQIESVINPSLIKGERYPEAAMREVDSENYCNSLVRT